MKNIMQDVKVNAVLKTRKTTFVFCDCSSVDPRSLYIVVDGAFSYNVICISSVI